jgi:hypothetical protein
MGGNSQMLKVPAAGLDIVVLVNRHDVSGILLTNKILDACLPDLEPIRKARDSFVTGTFRSPRTGRVIQLFGKDGQQIASIDGCDLPFESAHDGTLRPTSRASYLKQAVTLAGDPGQPVWIGFSDFGNLDELVPVEPTEDSRAFPLAGRYRSDATGIEATIVETGNGSIINTVGRFGSVAYHLDALADGVWRTRSTSPMAWGGIVSFERDGLGFRFSTPCTWALRFRRVPA